MTSSDDELDDDDGIGDGFLTGSGVGVFGLTWVKMCPKWSFKEHFGLNTKFGKSE